MCKNKVNGYIISSGKQDTDIAARYRVFLDPMCPSICLSVQFIKGDLRLYSVCYKKVIGLKQENMYSFCVNIELLTSRNISASKLERMLIIYIKSITYKYDTTMNIQN